MTNDAIEVGDIVEITTGIFNGNQARVISSNTRNNTIIVTLLNSNIKNEIVIRRELLKIVENEY